MKSCKLFFIFLLSAIGCHLNAQILATQEIAQKSLDMWITHIESEQGFTRRYAHWIYDDTVSLIGIGRGRTRERAISGARGAAELLIRYGYTPNKRRA